MTSTFVGHTLGFPGMAAYGAAKAGLVGLVRVAPIEAATAGVRINAIVSGGVDTPMGAEGAGSPERQDFVNSLHAPRRIAAPEELAEVTVLDLAGLRRDGYLVVPGALGLEAVELLRQAFDNDRTWIRHAGPDQFEHRRLPGPATGSAVRFG